MAIDPKLVSIKEAKDLPTAEAQSTSDFLFFEDQILKKSPMSNIYDKVVSGIKGVATQANAPTVYTPEAYPNGLFETYVVRTPLTMPNSWGSAVTQAELDANNVFFDVRNGVVSKELSLKPTVSIDEFISSNNIFDTSYIADKTVLNSSGNVVYNATSYIGFETIIGFPIADYVGKSITFSNFPTDANKLAVLKASDGTTNIGSVFNFGTLPKTISVPTGAVTLAFMIKRSADSVRPPNIMLNVGTTSLPYDVLTKSINKINDTLLIASALSSDNKVPNPINPQNAVNLSFLQNFGALNLSDLTLKASKNLAILGANIINDQFIGTLGTKNPGVGWKMLKIDISSVPNGSPITFGNFTIDVGGYSSFWNLTDDTMMLSNGVHYGNTPKTVVKPTDAKWLYIDISRPTGTNFWDNMVVNSGGTLIDYVSPSPQITKIKGYDIGGGSSSVLNFQDLLNVPPLTGNAGKAFKVKADLSGLEVFTPIESGSDVIFNSVKTNILDLSDLPTWDEIATTTIVSGQIYLKVDGSNYQLKVKG